MLTLKQRISAIQDTLTINANNYDEQLEALTMVEQEIPVYRWYGNPAWMCEDAKKEIASIREWIAAETR